MLSDYEREQLERIYAFLTKEELESVLGEGVDFNDFEPSEDQFNVLLQISMQKASSIYRSTISNLFPESMGICMRYKEAVLIDRNPISRKV
jgi:hypothetical protein